MWSADILYNYKKVIYIKTVKNMYHQIESCFILGVKLIFNNYGKTGISTTVNIKLLR